MELNSVGFLLCRVIPFAMASFLQWEKGHLTKFISSWQAIRTYLYANGNEPFKSVLCTYIKLGCIHTVFIIREC